MNAGGRLFVIGEEDGGIKNNGDEAIKNNGGIIRIGNPTGNIKNYPTIEADKVAINGNFIFDGGRLIGSNTKPYSGSVTHSRPYCEIVLGKAGEKNDATVRTEKEPPKIVITANPGNDTPTNGNVTLTITVTDNLSGVQKVTVVVDGVQRTLSIDSNGKATVIVTSNQVVIVNAEDRVGNSSSEEYEVKNIDRDAGNVIHSDVENAKPGNVVDFPTIILENILPDAEDIVEIYVSNSPSKPSGTGDWIPYTDNLEVPWVLDTEEGNGEKIVYIWAKDEAGNISTKPYELPIILEAKLIGGMKNKVTLNFIGYDENLMKHTLKDSNITYQAGSNNLGVRTRELKVVDDNYQYKGVRAIKFMTTLKNITGSGKLYMTITQDTLVDKAGNKNVTTTPAIDTGYTVDTNAPTITTSGATVTIQDVEDNIVAVTLNNKLVSRDGTGIGTLKPMDVLKVYDKAGNVSTYKVP